MSSHRSHSETTSVSDQSQAYDDAERGLYDSSQSTLALPALAVVEKKSQVYAESRAIESTESSIHKVPTGPSTARTSPWAARWKALSTKARKPLNEKARSQRKASRWTLFQLWFNTYKKFFVFCTTINLVGIIMAAAGHFPYAENHLGALVLGNLLFAILMRNELFLRILYTIAIYGLRSVRFPFPIHFPQCLMKVSI
jgi:hypothetical protein